MVSVFYDPSHIQLNECVLHLILVFMECSLSSFSLHHIFITLGRMQFSFLFNHNAPKLEQMTTRTSIKTEIPSYRFDNIYQGFKHNLRYNYSRWDNSALNICRDHNYAR